MTSSVELTPTVLALFVLAGFLTGWVDAVGGGGGLVQLPSLLLGLPTASAGQLLATNKLGAVVGTVMSASTYARRVGFDWRTTVPMAVVAFCGSAFGATLSSHLAKEAMTPIVLVLLIGVGTFILARPDLGRPHEPRRTPRRRAALAGIVGLVIGTYDGALGPGTGSFLVFALVTLVGYGFLQASATAKVVNVATNLGALAVFLPRGLVVWPAALALAAGNLCGGYVGARVAVARGSRFVRTVFLAVVTVFVIRLGGTVLRVW
jgi:uncharacterized membrane protein YfcA